MPDKFFLDTNVFVYTFDDGAPEKRERARALVAEALATGNGLTGYQVVQEFLNVATRKFARPMTAAEAARFLAEVLTPLCRVFASIELYRRGLDLAERWRFSFYDALVVAAALQASCRTLYTEDLPHGQRVESLHILNPFKIEGA
ncbi:MAG: PIN domain-containing protein [Gammaproteobacteria bacterium]|jgi:predicted nucleic acid-binding protein|nr:PIN domain-containing protein [Gammaproteobacteria bacterium]